jgi:60 kDa SS-A/Ro ribonucleoprotein
MATQNRKVPTVRTHEGGTAQHLNPELQLRRSVMACMLWEDSFYESGIDIAERIKQLVPLVKPDVVSAIAYEARTNMNLRHAPLLIVREMARANGHKSLVANTLQRVIQRADELTEFLALYWKDGKQKLSAQVKKGLANAFPKFDAYNLAKYNRLDKAVKLRDVLFLSHAKPITPEQGETWKKLIDGKLESPDTWEVNLSAGKGKKETWERLIAEKKLGALALLRNLRNMEQAGVPRAIVKDAISQSNVKRVLPFRFIAAARYAPHLEPVLEQKMFESISEMPKLPGTTVILVDVSGSMDTGLAGKTDMTRIDAACGVAMVLREICENVEVATFSHNTVKLPPRRGFALRDAIVNSQVHGSTYLARAIASINNEVKHDRIVVISDEQSHDGTTDPLPNRHAYMINVAAYQNGVGYGRWTHIDGFSEAVVRYIAEYERSGLDK